MRQRTVLLIASNPREVQRTRRTLARAGLHHIFRVVSDGEEALAYLRREGAYTDPHQAPRPDVVVLDLPLPRLSGLELVQCLKQDQRLKRLPVIVLTTSLCPDEARQVYAAGANAYVRKPVDCSRLTQVLGHLGRFWLETVELPSDA